MQENPWLVQDESVVNPWLTGVPDEAADAPADGDVAVSVAVEVPGAPASPQPGIDPVEALPLRRQAEHAALWCVGAHGGAGETTLAALVETWRAGGHAWPQADGDVNAILVARSHVTGLQAARAAMTQWAAGAVPGVRLVGLVVVADAPGKLPRKIRELMEVIGGGVPRVWHVPWVEAWRLAEQASLDEAPHRLRRVIADVTAHLEGKNRR